MLDDRKLYHYWMNNIKRAKKAQPSDAWTRAEEKLLIKDLGKQPYLSGFRLLYESLKSFLDQNSPQFDIQATKTFMSNPVAVKWAEADSAMLNYIWDEQGIQKSQSQKLDSTLIRNVGYTLNGFDVKKWLPTCKYLKSRYVGIDPDCDGQIENASWIYYEDNMSLEEFKAAYNLSQQDMKSIQGKAGSILTEKEQEDLPTGADRNMFKTVKVFHIFARGDAAIRKSEEDEVPTESMVEELKLSVPKRHLQYVEGIERPIYDDDWPYELDDSEFPITKLSFNTMSESLYSYTDNDHMDRVDTFCDNLLADIEENSKFTARKKFGGRPSANSLSPAVIENFMSNPDKYYLPDILDSQGNPKMSMIDVGRFEYPLMQAYQLINETRREASALGELLSTHASEYKDVTALAASIHDANAHQRINRRLGGPEGYEVSIAEDAIKILEIAHQEIPRYSTVEMEVPDEFGELSTDIVSLPWGQAQQVLTQGGKLVQLGADAIIGDLAEFWRTADEFSPLTFKLSTAVKVMPGSTREATKEKKAAIMKQYYLEVIGPLYELVNRPDLAVKYVKAMGYAAGIDNIDEYLPDEDDAQKVRQENEVVKQKEIQDQLNAPDERELMEQESRQSAAY